METPRDKAIQLADKYYNEMNPNQHDCNISYSQAIECAKIAVEDLTDNGCGWCMQSNKEYWDQVLNELNKL